MENDVLGPIYDIFGSKYLLGHVCGKGGQGATYFVRDNERILIKLINQNPEVASRRIREIKGLRISEKTQIAMPLFGLKAPTSGYVIRFMDGMCSLQNLLTKKTDENIFEFWNRTSSPKRRYLLLRKLCEILCDLDEKGIVYADLSPNNIFVSKSFDDYEVWLIDGDNLHQEGRTLYGKFLAVGTPNYWAPEIEKGQTNTRRSDEYSFAVIAFKLLTLISPFDGVADQTANDWDAGWEETEDTKLPKKENLLPWVGNRNDRSNAQVKGIGIPLETLVDEKLYELFRRNFEEGLLDPSKRPNIHEWIQPLFDLEKSCLDILTDTRQKASLPTFYLSREWEGANRGCLIYEMRKQTTYYAETEEGFVKSVQPECTKRVIGFPKMNPEMQDFPSKGIITLDSNDLFDEIERRPKNILGIDLRYKPPFRVSLYVNDLGRFKISFRNKKSFRVEDPSSLEDLEIFVDCYDFFEGRRNPKRHLYRSLFTFKKWVKGDEQ